MTFEHFKQFIDNHQLNYNSLDKLYDLGFDFLENEKFPLYDYLFNTLELFIKSHYNEYGWGWVEWFVFENNYGESKLAAHDENGNLICQTLEELFILLETQYKL
jgi:hypothetical protein